MPPDRRPDPEALLARIREEERQAGRGRLKIFFGAVARRGQDLRHAGGGPRPARGRAWTSWSAWSRRTAAPRPPPCSRACRRSRAAPSSTAASRSQEFDLDAALARRPGLLLVDELAHTNAPGSRHAKRWQDVEELLDAGISVYTTLNVQHIESLNDVVAQITGVTVRETLPDAVFDQADETRAGRPLGRRPARPPPAGQGLRAGAGRGGHGAVLPQGQPDRAARADAAPRGRAGGRADARLHARGRDPRRPGRRRSGSWSASARIPTAPGWCAPGKRMAASLRCEWRVVYVERAGPGRLGRRPRRAGRQPPAGAVAGRADRGARAARTRPRRSWRTPATTTSPRSSIGKPTHPRWRDALFGSAARPAGARQRRRGRLRHHAATGRRRSAGGAPRPGGARPLAEYAWAGLVVAVCTALARSVSSASLSVDRRGDGVPARRRASSRRATGAGPSLVGGGAEHRGCSTSSSSRRTSPSPSPTRATSSPSG